MRGQGRILNCLPIKEQKGFLPYRGKKMKATVCSTVIEEVIVAILQSSISSSENNIYITDKLNYNCP